MKNEKEQFEITESFLQTIYEEYERLYGIDKYSIELEVKNTMQEIYNSACHPILLGDNKLQIADTSSSSKYIKQKTIIISDKKKKQFVKTLNNGIEQYIYRTYTQTFKNKLEANNYILYGKPIGTEDGMLICEMYDKHKKKILNIYGKAKISNILQIDYTKENQLYLFKCFKFYSLQKQNNRYLVEVANKDTKILSIYMNIIMKKIKKQVNVTISYSHIKFDQDNNRALVFISNRRISKAISKYITEKMMEYTGVTTKALTEKSLLTQTKKD